MPNDFHSRCDFMGPTLTLIKKLKSGVICGGFTMKDWNSIDGCVRDEEAFIFNLNLEQIFLPSNTEKAIYCLSYFGPSFGDGALSLSE